MRKRYKNSFKNSLLKIIQDMESAIVLRADINDFGEPRQISRALKALVEDGELIKFGYGVYIKSEKTRYSDEPIMVIPIAEAYIEVFKRFGIRWELGQAIQDYNSGKTQQVPARFIVRLKDRFRRQLGSSGREIVFEGRVNAR